MKSALLLLALCALVPTVAADPGPATPGHADVFLPPLMACTWSGSYKPYIDTPLATVWVYTCDPET